MPQKRTIKPGTATGPTYHKKAKVKPKDEPTVPYVPPKVDLGALARAARAKKKKKKKP